MTNTQQELSEYIELFRNNVLCRYESNQNKANTIFNTYIKPHIDYVDYIDLIDSWSEYMNGDIDIDQFGQIINNLKNEYPN